MFYHQHSTRKAKRLVSAESLECSRRSFLGLSAALLASSLLPPRAGAEARPFFQRHRLPLGLQMYTVSGDAKRDLSGTLHAIAGMGYRTVELAGLYDKSPAQWRTALANAGLKCPAAHIAQRPLAPGPSLEDSPAMLAELAHGIGCDTVVCPLFCIPERFEVKPNAGEGVAQMLARIGAALTQEDWIQTAEYLNKKGAALKHVGLRFAYHNHNIEFAPVGNSTGFEILMRRTDPKLVSFEMDAGWVAAAGVDPQHLLTRFPGRFSGMHIKDIKSGTVANFALQLDPSPVGKGTINWPQLLDQAYKAGVRQFYVEQEPPFTNPPLDEAAVSIKYLQGIV
jgi:sugar phosphate isomerase/epimerase